MLDVATVVAQIAATLTFVAGSCPGLGDVPGCYDASTRTVFTSASLPRATRRFVRVHEIGHASEERLEEGERRRFRTLVERFSEIPFPDHWENRWTTTRGAGPVRADQEPGLQEIYADTFALCALGRTGSALTGGYGLLASTRRQHRVLCRFIGRALDVER